MYATAKSVKDVLISSKPFNTGASRQSQSLNAIYFLISSLKENILSVRRFSEYFWPINLIPDGFSNNNLDFVTYLRAVFEMIFFIPVSRTQYDTDMNLADFI